jgi:hypothetical protein
MDDDPDEGSAHLDDDDDAPIGAFGWDLVGRDQ